MTGTQIDPTTVRLSDHFLLSDFMGCDSVYRLGLPNRFVGGEEALEEARVLCRHVLEPLLVKSRLSISYGYISPELSRHIVKYQDPDMPSYHRWDHGAACDIILHEYAGPPIKAAFWADDNLPMSRTITYSESPFICVATRASEVSSGEPRRALYENRYEGVRKPKYVRYSDNYSTRSRQKQSHKLSHKWRGAGHPTYHGGGRCQLQHRRTGRYTVLSDFLYSKEAVSQGRYNYPRRSLDRFFLVADVYDYILDTLDIRRMSIVRGYESPLWTYA